MNNVGKNIKNARNRREMTQEELADRVHVTRQAVSNWETGKTRPDIDMLMLMAEAMETDTSELIYGITKVDAPYEKKQKKYVIWASICAAAALAGLVSEFTVFAAMVEKGRLIYNMLPALIYTFTVRPASIFAFGMFLPAFMSLFTDIRLQGRKRTAALIAGIVLILPIVALAVQFIAIAIDPNVPQPVTVVYYRAMIRYDLVRFINNYVLPSASGILIFLGTNK